MSLKSWREVAVPHPDVLKGTFQLAEFAADISAVHSGKAPAIYQDPVTFFDRTYITEGMGLLLAQVARRLGGLDGEPVIQLQTAFGGGKTHTMLAVYHLATREVPLKDLPNVAPLIERAGLMDVPRARVAVIDGVNLAPGQPRKRGRSTINTLWGELAWQLGGSEGLTMVQESDANGTSPGKEVLRELLEAHAPCVILMDEAARYLGQFEEGKSYSGGTFDSNLSFVQSLTEAVKLVPTAVLLASLPDSAPASSGDRGRQAIGALEHMFGRVQALWKPVATEEAFEIVRRRLFEPIRDTQARDAVCRAFADTYVQEGAKLPGETQEGRYFDRLCQAYPIHPEFFDRLYEDWTTIDGFQRTRGVLKLMAKVIFRLWKDNNQDLMIQPGSLPLSDANVRGELTYLLSAGWDPVIEGDIDGDRAETTDLEAKEPRFGQVNAARRVARTLFLGTAPSSLPTKPGIRGLDRARVLLGCLQPGQSSAAFTDALGRLADRLHYLNSNGEKTDPATRYWFNTTANLRREMEDRKRRFDDADVRRKTKEVVTNLFGSTKGFDAVHAFVSHSDVTDDSSLRLIILSPDQWFTKDSPRQATDAVLEYLKMRGDQPRHRANRLLFLAADQPVLNRLKDATRAALAWASIVDDVDKLRLNIDQNQKIQALKESQAAETLLPRVVRECFRWFLCPSQADARADRPEVEAFPLNTTGGQASTEPWRICKENELVIEEWAPIHLRTILKDFYWKDDRPSVPVSTIWNDSLRYLFLPRLKDRQVLQAVVRAGSARQEYFGTADGEAAGKYEGFQFGSGDVSFAETLLLIEPGSARHYDDANKVVEIPEKEEIEGDEVGKVGPEKVGPVVVPGGREKIDVGVVPPSRKMTSFQGTIEVPAASAKMKFIKLADEIVDLLASDPNALVRVTVELAADFPKGVSEDIKRGVSENAMNLDFRSHEWE